MCTSTPKIPPPPPPPQAAKQADTNPRRRSRQDGAMTGGTLLTSPSGVASNTANLGGTTLLGG